MFVHFPDGYMQRHALKIGSGVLLAFTIGAMLAYFFTYQRHAQAPTTERPVRILVPLPLKSPVGADAYRKIKFALEKAGGKAGTRTVELVPVDLSYLKNTGKLEDVERLDELARQLSDKDVVGVLGPITTDAALLAAPLINAAGLAQISYTTTYPGFTMPNFADPKERARLFPSGIQTFFSLVPHTLDMAHAVSSYLVTQGTPNVFLINDKTSFSETATKLVRDAYTERDGTIVGARIISSESDTTPTDTENIVNEIIASKAQIVFITSYPHDNYYAFLNALHDRNYAGTIMGYNMQRNYIDEKMSALQGILSVNYTPTLPWSSNDATYKFIRNYQATHPENPDDLMSIFTPYDAMNMMLYAIKNSDGTRAGVLNVLATLKNFVTLYGPVSFDENGYRTRNPMEVSELKNGAFVFKELIEP